MAVLKSKPLPFASLTESIRLQEVRREAAQRLGYDVDPLLKALDTAEGELREACDERDEWKRADHIMCDYAARMRVRALAAEAQLAHAHRTLADPVRASGDMVRRFVMTEEPAMSDVYVSRPAEVRARQLTAPSFNNDLILGAERIVAWVNANGGEARYEPEWIWRGEDSSNGRRVPPRIAVRTINGWAYAAPGHYIVMGSAWFVSSPYDPSAGLSGPKVRDFYPCDPATFEKHWAAAGDPCD